MKRLLDSLLRMLGLRPSRKVGSVSLDGQGVEPASRFHVEADEDMEAETREILADKKFMARLRKIIGELERGEVRAWEDVRAELNAKRGLP